jgi:GLPGLI family protein
MKKLIFCLLCLWATAALEAQNNEGYIRYLVTHNWSKKYAAVDYISKQQRERDAYVWGGSRAEWKMFANYYFSEKGSKYEDSEESAEADDEGYSWRKEAYLIHRNFETGQMTDVITMLGKAYVIEDSIQTQDWKILNEMKEIAGHVCMNAQWTDTVKLQKITAWFALDMPVPGGPERLGGLPGMILEVDINNGGMLITADKIELKPLTNELALPKKLKGKKIKEANYVEMLKKHVAEKKKAEQPPYWGIRY